MLPSSTISSSCYLKGYMQNKQNLHSFTLPPPILFSLCICGISWPSYNRETYPSLACLAPTPPPGQIELLYLPGYSLSSSQRLKHASVNANFLRFKNKAIVVAFFRGVRLERLSPRVRRGRTCNGGEQQGEQEEDERERGEGRGGGETREGWVT